MTRLGQGLSLFWVFVSLVACLPSDANTANGASDPSRADNHEAAFLGALNSAAGYALKAGKLSI